MNKLIKTGATLSTAAVLATGVAVGGALADGGASGPNQSAAPSAAAASAAAKAGPAKARVFAAVRADGSKHRGRGFVSSTKVIADGPGVYEVFFDRNIKKCAWSGTVGYGGFSGATGPAMITITGRVGTNNGLYVTTYDQDGTATDLPFLTTVVCK